MSFASTGNHNALESAFQSNLQAFGGAYAGVTATIDFTSNVGQPQPTALGWNRPDNKVVMNLAGELDISNVLGTDGSPSLLLSSLTTDEVSAIGNAFMAAYNEAHADTPWEMTSFQIKRIVDVPDTNGDGSMVQASDSVGRIVRWYRYSWYFGGFGCNFCPPNMVLQGTDLSYAIMPPNRQPLLQSLFCHRLRNIGISVYNNIHACTIRFQSNEMDGGSQGIFATSTGTAGDATASSTSVSEPLLA